MFFGRLGFLKLVNTELQIYSNRKVKVHKSLLKQTCLPKTWQLTRIRLEIFLATLLDSTIIQFEINTITRYEYIMKCTFAQFFASIQYNGKVWRNKLLCILYNLNFQSARWQAEGIVAPLNLNPLAIFRLQLAHSNHIYMGFLYLMYNYLSSVLLSCNWITKAR